LNLCFDQALPGDVQAKALNRLKFRLRQELTAIEARVIVTNSAAWFTRKAVLFVEASSIFGKHVGTYECPPNTVVDADRQQMLHRTAKWVIN
jgi:CMP-N-acetylneuraminic acid synthetase